MALWSVASWERWISSTALSSQSVWPTTARRTMPFARRSPPWRRDARGTLARVGLEGSSCTVIAVGRLAPLAGDSVLSGGSAMSTLVESLERRRRGRRDSACGAVLACVTRSRHQQIEWHLESGDQSTRVLSVVAARGRCTRDQSPDFPAPREGPTSRCESGPLTSDRTC